MSMVLSRRCRHSATPTLILIATTVLLSFVVDDAKAFSQTAPRIMMMSSNNNSNNINKKKKKGKLLVLGGTGFLGQTVCKRAVLEGYDVTSLSRRGLPPGAASSSASPIDYRRGDARQKGTVADILNNNNDDDDDGGYTGIIHCIGLLFDSNSGLADYNVFVSGSGSLPDESSTYDTVTRLTAFYAIDACVEYNNKRMAPMPFCFVSAAEAGWPEVPGGTRIERFLAPSWLKRYLAAKRAVETKLFAAAADNNKIRPIVFRPSLIYSMDRLSSPQNLVPVGAFFVGNKIGLPFVDRPVTVQALACAIVRSMDNNNNGDNGAVVSGVQRFKEIDELSR